MVEYKCDKCGKIYSKKFDYNRHMKRKNPCTSSTQNIVVVTQKNVDKIEQNLKCTYCEQVFSRIDSLNRHTNSFCKIKIKQKENEKEEIFKQLLQEMIEQNKELKNQINKLEKIGKQNEIILEENKELKNKIGKKNINKRTINNTNNNILDQSNNINNFNIQLVAYGKEDYDKLTEKEYKIIINKGYKSVQEMVKSLHFHKNRPENHNIYISNIRDNYVMIYDGNKWELRNRKETIEELYIAKKDILVEKFDELLNKLPGFAIDKFERFINDV